jgi:UDP-GlcNAc:undecaprenyl-phosphate GlcNAc-1-phosphate transferase
MLSLLNSVFEAVVIGIILSYILCLVSIRWSKRVGLIDIPGKLPHKQHRESTPIAGGIAFFLALLMGFFLFRVEFGEHWKLLLPVMIVFLTGVLDDYRPLPYLMKLLGQAIAAVLLIAFGYQVNFLKPEFLGLALQVIGALNILVTIIWLVGIANAFNFVDSMDGLATGMAAIVSLLIACASLFSGQLYLARLMGLVGGISLILYYFNVMPARLFLGDSGALTIGFLMAVGAMVYNPKIYPQGSTWFMPIMILGVPIFDMCLVIFSRLRRSRPVYQADQGHTYHRLVSLGITPNRAVVSLHVVSILLGCLAIITMQYSLLVANAVFFSLILMGGVLVLYLDHPSRWP